MNKKVLVTGGSGFLGSNLVKKLNANGASVFIPRSVDTNLVDFDQTMDYFAKKSPDIVLHLAAYYGGIGINQIYPGKIFFENLIMGANVMEVSRRLNVKKTVTIGTACSYPGSLEGEFKEKDFWNGIPHESVVNYGLVKKVLTIQGLAYKKQYDFNSIHLILTNLYGPKDSFNPERSHVVAALIRKFVEAEVENKPEVEVWGTGKPIREFLYVEDCAKAILLATEKYNDLMPLNIGTGMGTSIKELARKIKEISRYQGGIIWNTNKLDGQPKKILDITKMKKVLAWEPPTSLTKGLDKTINWYIKNKEQADEKW